MFIIDDPSSAVLAGCDYDAKSSSYNLRLHIRPNGGSLEEELYVQFPAYVCSGETADAFRQFADTVAESDRARKSSGMEFVEIPGVEDGNEEERAAAFAMIDEGWKRLKAVAERGRVRRTLTGPVTLSDLA